jgi:acyl transferase domain-containing protein
MSDADKIALIGAGVRFPDADTVDRFWANIVAGRRSVKRFDREELIAAGIDPAVVDDPAYVPVKGALAGIDRFDRAFFGYSPGEAAMIDPQQRLFLETAWEALESAGYDPYRFAGRIGLYAGSGMNTYLPRQLATAVDLTDTATLYQAMIGNDKDFLATRVAYLLNLKGPAVAVQCACSTSLVAIHMACQSLIAGECDMAMAGGVTVRTPVAEGYLWSEGMILAPDGVCRPFDAAAAGTVPGAGAGTVLLKRYADAVADGDPIRAVILGSAINNDGAAKVGYTAPSVAGQAEVIAEAHGVAGIDAATLGYVECHGTGTPMGDPIEIAALAEAFAVSGGKRGRCAIGGVKANIGHCDAAAGVAGFVKAALTVERGVIPPAANFTTPNAAIDFAATPFYVPTEATPWPLDGPRRAGVSAFGIGGANAHVVVEQPPVPPAVVERDRARLLTLSAKDDAALAAMGARLADAFDADGAPTVADVGYTLATGRVRFDRRRAVVATNRREAATRLREETATIPAAPMRLVFMFTGQGAQYPGMGAELYETEPAYRTAFDEAAALFGDRGVDVAALLHGEAPALTETGAAQPALFTVEYALAKLWMSWGVVPDAMIGHSVGEFVAATLAGVTTVADAVRLVAERAALMQAAPAGAMLALATDEATARRIADEFGLDVAAVNGPKSVVVAGDEAAAAAAETAAARAGIAARRLKTSHAFHSRSMDLAAARLVAAASSIRFGAPTIPYIADTTGQFVTAVDAPYWGAHLRSAVRFADGVATLTAAGPTVFVEIGPGATLAKLAAASAGKGDRLVATLPGHGDARSAVETTLTALGVCWSAGADVDPAVLYPPGAGRRVSLPTYPFQRVRCWAEGERPVAPPRPAARRPVAEWFMSRGWRQSVNDAAEQHGGPWLVVGGGVGAATAVGWMERQGYATGDVDPSAILLVDPDYATAVATAARFADGDRALVALTRNGAALFDTDRLDPAAAMTVAALRVVGQERPGWRVAALDIGAAEPTACHFAAALRLAADRNGPMVTAWRGGALWEEEFRPTPIRNAGRFAVTDGQVWVVTGGPGGVASVLAEALAERANVKIAFVSRSGKGEGVDRLTALGATVVCYAADVADREALTGVWRRIETTLGTVVGVVHAAGITGVESFAPLEEGADGAPHFVAKIDGTENIARLAAGVERVMLVSSVAAVLGGVGRIAYAAANGWMDAFAVGRDGRRWTSVGWDAWALDPTGARWESAAVDPVGGKEAFMRIVTGRYRPHLLVAPAGLDRREAFAPVAATKAATSLTDGGQALAGKIAAAWRAVLGVANVAGDDDFFALGGDSLMATRALSRMKSDHGIDAPMALFFEAPTPAGLAALLERRGAVAVKRERVSL